MEAENEKQKEVSIADILPEKNKTYVYSKRDLKEYLGESFLIIFSVLLALAATEFINKMHERENTKTMLRSIITELNHNKKYIQEMHVYNLQVLGRIDSALLKADLQERIVSNDEFHLNEIAPDGVLFRYLDNNAWTIAKNNNIMSKIDIESVSILTRVYEDRDEIMKVEDEVARIILDRAARDPKHIHGTLILIRDTYHAWAVDREAGMLSDIDYAIHKIETLENVKNLN